MKVHRYTGLIYADEVFQPRKFVLGGSPVLVCKVTPGQVHFWRLWDPDLRPTYSWPIKRFRDCYAPSPKVS